VDPRKQPAANIAAEQEPWPSAFSEATIPQPDPHLTDIQLLLHERQKLLEKLLDTELRFTLAYARAPIGMVLLTPDGRITETNQAFQQMLGYTQQELLAGDSAPFTHPDDIALTRNFFASLIAGPHNTGSIEKRYLRKSGEMLWARASATLQRDEAGKPSHVVATVEDITERKQVETRYRFLAESIPQMVWTATPNGLLDYVNGQGVAYFGASQEEILGAGWLARVHPEDRDPTLAIWKHSLETGQPYETEFRLKRKDGAWRCHLVRALPLTSEKGGIAQWFGTCTDIEDQKQSDSVLRQQWHTFDTALSHSPDFTYIFDRGGRFTYVNKALLALWQKSLEEACGKNFFELGYPPELAKRLQLQIQQVFSTQQPLRDQTPFTGPTGETRYYDYIFVPVFDVHGQVEAVAGSTRDITEQNLATQQIDADRQRWRDLLAQTPAAIALLRGPDHLFEWVNPSFSRLVGRPAGEIIGKTVSEAVSEVNKQIYLGLLNGVYQTGEPFTGHESLVRLPGPDGVVRDCYINFVYLPTRGRAGIIDGIFVHITDVTEAVLARRRIEESETQFRTLAETIPHLAWMADEIGNRFWYNRRWYDYTGTTFDEVKDSGWEKVHDPAVLPQVLEHWRKAISAGVPFEMTFPLKSAQGAFRSFLTRVEPVKDNSGRVVRWFGTNTDITEQQQTEQELRRTNRDLEEFSFVASHDLQEPLRTINIYTQLLTRRFAGGEPEAAKYAERINTGIRRMEALIEDLLAFSRATHADETPPGTANLADAWSDALSVLKDRIEESGAVITSCALPTTRGDMDQMSHVFQNILSNSLKYRKKDLAPEIRISAHRDGDNWTISVQDNGIGFHPQYAERIFGLFKRLHKDEYPGTGLGLAICKRIVERYGGRMWADATPGQGATIYISLPE